MADEDVTLETEDSTHDADTQAEVDWQKRYTDTQAEYTRNQQALKDAQSVWEDEQALLARIEEKFPHLLAEDETVEDDDSSDEYDEPDVMTKAEFKAWQDEQKQIEALRESQRQFENDFKSFVGDRELDKYGEAALRAGSYKSPEELQAAIDGYFEHLASLGGGTRRKPKAPHVPTGGRAATGVPNYSEMSRDEAEQAMLERARALEAQ